jgi:hypothetical protein
MRSRWNFQVSEVERTLQHCNIYWAILLVIGKQDRSIGNEERLSVIAILYSFSALLPDLAINQVFSEQLGLIFHFNWNQVTEISSTLKELRL